MAVSGQTIGKNAVLGIDDGTGASRAVDGDISDSTITLGADTPENTTYGDPAHSFQTGGLLTEGFSMNGWFNDTATTGIETILSGIGAGGSTRYIVGPAGSTSDYRKYTACAVLQNWEIGIPVADMVNITATFVIRAGSTSASSY